MSSRTFLISVELDFSLNSRAGETATQFVDRVMTSLERTLEAEGGEPGVPGGAFVVRADISLWNEHGSAEVYTTKSMSLDELTRRRDVAQLAGEWAVVRAYSERIEDAKAEARR